MARNNNRMPVSNLSSMMSNVVITGGTIFQQYHLHTSRNGLELLQAATSPAAFHDSGERYDPPKCHPNTRVAVMKAITDWTLGLDEGTREKYIMWLTGAAGAGKSAILQSFAEQQDSEGRLLSGFFFGKSDPDRNNSRKLVATIAYQIHKKIPNVRQHIVNAVEEDPLIFTRSLFAQFTTLVVQPLQATSLRESGFFNQIGAPRVIVIDGLDECIDRREQKDVLLTISRITQQRQVPVLFLISSRPEHDILTTFSSSQLRDGFTRLDLDERFSPENDIESYLRHEFQEINNNHPFRRSIPPSWPSDFDIAILVWKSSGQFIYAATVINYVGSSRHRPHHRLEVVLNLRPVSQSEVQPFAELDALYMHILSGVSQDSISVVLHVMSFLFYSNAHPLVAHIEAILQLEDDAISLAFCDLGALVSIGTDPSHSVPTVKILHTSFRDFLLDQARSEAFHVKQDYLQNNAIKCLQFISIGERDPSRDVTFEHSTETYFPGYSYLENININNLLNDAIEFLGDTFKYLEITGPLLDALYSFPFSRCYSDGSKAAVALFGTFHNYFLPELCKLLENSDLEEAKCVYRHCLGQLREALISHMSKLGIYNSQSESRFALHLALFCHYPSSSRNVRSKGVKLPPICPASLVAEFTLYDRASPAYQHSPDFRLLPTTYDVMGLKDGYIKLLSRLSLLSDPKEFQPAGDSVSQELQRTFAKEVYAGAARCSLEFLCGITDSDSFVSSHRRFDLYTSSLRRNSP